MQRIIIIFIFVLSSFSGSTQDNIRTIAPGEDGQEKIRKNLFLKMMVDRKSCFVGEPVVATFKLYSRLESRSDIVKNPGFYGFTVYDMVNLDDRQSVTERINGKTFDVHTIRKVQLYPLQAGQYTIDAMEVKNRVAFSKSRVYEKAEQEIIEGVPVEEDEDSTTDGNLVIFENSIHTEPISIGVKPLPVKNKPAFFNDATGVFLIRTSLSKPKFARNEEGNLELTISGQGNFTQLNAPVIQWPAGLEGFEPIVKDKLDKSQSPLQGSRTFNYAFAGNREGSYTIPAIAFSFFDPGTTKYKTVSTGTLEIEISALENPPPPVAGEKTNKEQRKVDLKWWMIAIPIIVLSSLIIFYSQLRKRRIKKIQPGWEPAYTGPSVDEILQPVGLLVQGPDKVFYSALYQATWDYLSLKLNLAGSELNKNRLFSGLREKKVNEENIAAISVILNQAETGIYTDAELIGDKNALIQKTRELLEVIGKGLL